MSETISLLYISDMGKNRFSGHNWQNLQFDVAYKMSLCQTIMRYSLPYRPTDIVLVDMARKGTGSWKKLVNGDPESLR